MTTTGMPRGASVLGVLVVMDPHGNVPSSLSLLASVVGTPVRSGVG